ncbi:MAG: tRNA (adenosine(37)-N6)-threonylcarbamoyltransferase complex dimerization subunit type 1 TsaB [Opitutaceae bacterium]|nr:tRNA (adenosine(37)-N6)-threonylcarbamoyltransferase complex dimerization subunit type 1 TsaB [Verrucomicrobiales bacterium]
MKILSLEFSSDRRSVALIDDGKVLGSAFESGGRLTRAAGLVQTVIGQSGCSEGALDGIVIGLGPGSNAGIRAAIAFAQGWALARRIKVAGLGSIELIATGCWLRGLRGPIDVTIDAQRGDFYLGCFEVSGDGWTESDALRIVSSDEMVQRIKAGRIVVSPDAVVETLGGQRIFPAAGDVSFVTLDKIQWVESDTLEPVYLRETNFVKAPLPRTFT